ncbi:hypothetical protein AB0L53_22055 [Nonomuraea sp. NPDC052129]|uniref:hypothetical protein n=1 Tax=Nonomuraea sp. NPDC052129 TaxID=3154651 RepID=UPI00341AD728
MTAQTGFDVVTGVERKHPRDLVPERVGEHLVSSNGETQVSTAIHDKISVELPEAFDSRWNRIPGITVDGHRVTLDPEAYFGSPPTPWWRGGAAAYWWRRC